MKNWEYILTKLGLRATKDYNDSNVKHLIETLLCSNMCMFPSWVLTCDDCPLDNFCDCLKDSKHLSDILDNSLDKFLLENYKPKKVKGGYRI